MTPSGIEPTTFQFVVQHLNHCATAVPDLRLLLKLKCLELYQPQRFLVWSFNIIMTLPALLFHAWNEEDQMGEVSSVRLEESTANRVSLSKLWCNEESYEKQLQQCYNIKMDILKEGYAIP